MTSHLAQLLLRGHYFDQEELDSKESRKEAASGATPQPGYKD